MDRFITQKPLAKTPIGYRRASRNCIDIVARVLREMVSKDVLITSLHFHEQVKGIIYCKRFSDVFVITLPQGKTVVETGVNIGDSDLFFGAIKIVGLEPFAKNYELAIKNIELNELSKIASILLAGCGGYFRYVTLRRDQGV